MIIGQDQFLQHFDRCLFKLGNGDLPIAELPDSIHIPPENLFEIQDDSSNAIRESLDTTWRRYFLTLMQTFMLQSNRGSLDSRKDNTNTNEQLS